MAKYDITYSCGHTETVQLYGKHADREHYIAWASEHKVCSECRKADREAEKAAAAERAKANGMTEGSDKQMAWACDLIEQAQRNLTCGMCAHTLNDAIMDEAEKRGIDPLDLLDGLNEANAEKGALRPVLEEAVGKAVAAAFLRPAKWAIDNRDHIGRLIAKDAAPELLDAILKTLNA